MPALRIGAGAFITRLPVLSIQVVNKTFTAAQWINLAGTPIQIAQAPGPSKAYIPFGAIYEVLSTGHTPFSDGSNVRFEIPDTDAYIQQVAARFIEADSNLAVALQGNDFEIPVTDIANQPLQVHVIGADFTGGTGTIVKGQFYFAVVQL